MAHTIRDVSQLSGVSTATVSRTFANPGSVREETRRRVMEAARLLNYQPNAIARSMARQQAETLAFLICKKGSSILDEFYAGIGDGVMRATNDSDYQMLVSTASEWATARRKQVDGLILGGDATLALISEYSSQNVKIVLVNNEIEGFSLPCVISDEEAGVRAAVEHLIERGHTKIGMLAGRFSPYICEIRYKAFRNTMRSHGLKVPDRYVSISDPDIESAMNTAKKMLTQKDPPTALFGANDEIATGIMKAAIRLGRRIPDDIAIVGYDDSRVCRALEPEMTSVRTDCFTMGTKAAELLLAILRGDEPKETRIVIQPELVVRGTS